MRLHYVKLRPSMLRARRSMYLEPPTTLTELSDLLMNPYYQVLTQTTDGEDNIFAGSVTTGEGYHHVLFASRRMLRLLTRIRYVFSDGTFKIVPSLEGLRNRQAQVFTIVTSWRGHTLPLAWVLMENRTQESNEAVLRCIDNLLEGRINISKVITDDEAAQHQAWGCVFQVVLQDCLWHMDRRMIRKITDLRLGHWFHNPNAPQFLYIIRLACALPLLPHNNLVLGWRLVRREARIQGGDMLRNLLRPFFWYLWDEFVGNPRKRRRVSVFGSAHRTNNCCESANRGLKDKFGPHPGIYDFIHGLVDLEDQAYLDFLVLDSGMQASRARRTSALRNDAALLRLGRELREAPFGNEDAVLRYLRAASHRIEDAVANLARLDDDEA